MLGNIWGKQDFDRFGPLESLTYIDAVGVNRIKSKFSVVMYTAVAS